MLCILFDNRKNARGYNTMGFAEVVVDFYMRAVSSINCHNRHVYMGSNLEASG